MIIIFITSNSQGLDSISVNIYSAKDILFSRTFELKLLNSMNKRNKIKEGNVYYCQ